MAAQPVYAISPFDPKAVPAPAAGTDPATQMTFLELALGQPLYLLKDYGNGWSYGTYTKDGETVSGFFPSGYVKPIETPKEVGEQPERNDKAEVADPNDEQPEHLKNEEEKEAADNGAEPKPRKKFKSAFMDYASKFVSDDQVSSVSSAPLTAVFVRSLLISVLKSMGKPELRT